MKFNIVNEIKLTYSREGNAEKLITNSDDAVEVFRAHLIVAKSTIENHFMHSIWIMPIMF